ncbi:MAG: peptide deformylase [Rickettsiaceae bacterium]|nr:peptide deformylase [Rickettsiaceae bacterium]
MTLLNIVTAPDPILKKPSREVESVNDSVRVLMKDMLETMYHDSGVGLAAVQVGIHKQIIVIDLQNDDDDERRAKDFYPLFLINPKITSVSENFNVATEGCLSVPSLRIDVPRPESINISYLNYDGEERELAAHDWLARVIQHEMDHLTGKLIIDYLSSIKKEMAISKLKKFKKQLL